MSTFDDLDLEDFLRKVVESKQLKTVSDLATINILFRFVMVTSLSYCLIFLVALLKVVMILLF